MKTQSLAMAASWSPKDLAIAVLGPMALGAAMGLSAGAWTMIKMAALIPACLLAVSLLILPGLYISSALVQFRLSLRELLVELAAAACDTGWILLGLAPTAFFLVSTSARSDEALLFAMGLSLVGFGLGAHACWRRLSTKAECLEHWCVLGIWGLVTLCLGAQFFFDAMIVSGGLL